MQGITVDLLCDTHTLLHTDKHPLCRFRKAPDTDIIYLECQGNHFQHTQERPVILLKMRKAGNHLTVRYPFYEPTHIAVAHQIIYLFQLYVDSFLKHDDMRFVLQGEGINTFQTAIEFL